MAYQSLNIIGSFTAGIPAVNRDIAEERSRVEAYRSLMRSQIEQARTEASENVSTLEREGRMFVGDAPHERRNPYFANRRAPNRATEQPTEEPVQPQDQEPLPTSTEEGLVGYHLDIVI